MGLMFCGDVSSGRVAGGLLVLLVCKRMKSDTVKMPTLQLSTPKKVISYQIFFKT